MPGLTRRYGATRRAHSSRVPCAVCCYAPARRCAVLTLGMVLRGWLSASMNRRLYLKVVAYLEASVSEDSKLFATDVPKAKRQLEGYALELQRLLEGHAPLASVVSAAADLIAKRGRV